MTGALQYSAKGMNVYHTLIFVFAGGSQTFVSVCGTLQGYFKWTRNPYQNSQVNINAFFSPKLPLLRFRTVNKIMHHKSSHIASWIKRYSGCHTPKELKDISAVLA